MTRKVSVKIVVKERLIPDWAAAQVLMPRTIWIKPAYKNNARILAHELAHVMQWERYGLKFAVMYLWDVARHGYVNSRFEVEAMAAENDEFYVDWARELINK
jgi:hypothetical protein